jgi:hypothetical protein
MANRLPHQQPATYNQQLFTNGIWAGSSGLKDYANPGGIRSRFGLRRFDRQRNISESKLAAVAD